MIPIRWQRPARVIWLVLVVLNLAVFVIALPDKVREWEAAAPLELAKIIFFYGIWLTVGGLLFLRKSGEWMALLTAYLLVTFPTQWDFIVENWMAAHPAVALPVQILRLVTSQSLVVFIALFPNGQFVPRWTRWLVLASAVYGLSSFLPPAWRPFGPGGSAADLAIGLGFIGGLIVAQIVRYRRYSTAIERQRTRWVIFGFSLSIGVIIVMVAVSLISTPLDPAIEPRPSFAIEILYQAAVVMMPLSIGVAILRNRLWDLDLLVRRTLVYSVLTGLLALAYLGSILVLQNVFQTLTGQGQDQLVTVISTLGIAALFVPLRRRVQDFIDHRFFRRKYDAAQTVAAFGSAVRDEVELNRLATRLVETVDSAVQPAHSSLWLKAQTNGRAGQGAGEGLP